MGNIAAIILVVVGTLWGLSVFLGYIGHLRSGLNEQQQMEAANSAELKEKQKQIAEEAEEKRQRFMEDIKYKMRDDY